MTQRHRDKLKQAERANLKPGLDHQLDDKTGDDLGRDPHTLSGGREGIAGIHDIKTEVGYRRLLEELNWWIAHADATEPGILSPMTAELDFEQVFSLARLTEPQAEVMLLKVEGHSVAQIGEWLGISPGAVQSRVNWARLKLKVWVSDYLLDTG